MRRKRRPLMGSEEEDSYHIHFQNLRGEIYAVENVGTETYTHEYMQQAFKEAVLKAQCNDTCGEELHIVRAWVVKGRHAKECNVPTWDKEYGRGDDSSPGGRMWKEVDVVTL
jgi:hypothetical protein